VTQDLNTFLAALYAKVDDEFEGSRWLGTRFTPMKPLSLVRLFLTA
jgi:hypothetical protein